MKAAHAMRFGAELRRAGGVRFALWAPSQERVEVQRSRRRQRLHRAPADAA